MSWNTGRLRDELTGDERAEVLSAASRARSDLLQAAQLVGFEGPETLSEALHPVIALSWEIIRAAQDFAEPRHERTLDEIHPDFAKALAEFRVAARHALEADE
ncbi:hypothetical protein ACF09Y_33620 [Streptomyces massasporeus]|uniref:hypothetical protein n=1 Tax=Streptomyces massasporeus TaxID=67324 RepID=UPI0037022541